MIKCQFCGHTFNSYEDFENHIDIDCSQPTQTNDCLEYIGNQVIYPDGSSEIRNLNIRFSHIRSFDKLKTSDEFLQRKKSDKDFTEPIQSIYKGG